MRIAIIGSRGIPAHYGGFETFAEELAPRLARRGHDVTVYCRAGYTGDPPPTVFGGVRLVHTPYVHRRSLETLSHEFTSILDSVRRRFDLYYFLGTRSSALYVPLRLSRRAIVVHTDGIEWRRGKWGSAGRAYLKGAEWIAARLAAQRLVTDAEAMREYFRRRHGRDSVFIPYGARVLRDTDPSALSHWSLEPGGYYLSVCRLEPENNLGAIIRGFADSGTGSELVIVGDPGYETRHQRDLREAARGLPVRFLGAVYERRQLDALRAGCAAYLHGHEVGGTNPSLLESMGAGACVLALDTPFNREALGDAGRFWTKDAGSLSDALHWVEENPREARGLGSRARRRIEERYDWERVADEHDRLFRDAARSSTSPRR